MNQNRQPPGVSTGGQYTTKTYAEADVSLGSVPSPDPRQRLYELLDEYDFTDEFNDSADAAEVLTETMDAVRAMRDEQPSDDDC